MITATPLRIDLVLLLMNYSLIVEALKHQEYYKIILLLSSLISGTLKFIKYPKLKPQSLIKSDSIILN